MTKETEPTALHDMEHLRDLMDREFEPYSRLAEYAIGLKFVDYPRVFIEDGKKKSKAGGREYLSTLGNTRIEDQSLAYDLAHIEDRFFETKKKIGGISIENPVRAKILEVIDGDRNSAVTGYIGSYVIAGEDFIKKYEYEIPSKVLTLEALSEEEIREQFDARPINKEDFANTDAGKGLITRAWNTLIYLAQYGDRTPYADRHVNNLPALIFHNQTENSQAGDYRDLDFMSFYKLIQAVDRKVAEENVKIPDVMGSNSGLRTLEVCKQVILRRAKR